MSFLDKKEKHFFNELRNASYSKTIPLTPKGLVYFHWGDFDLTCKYQQMLLTNDPYAIQKWQSLEMAMQFLKAFLVWVKNDQKIIETNLYELYLMDLFDKDNFKLILNSKSLVSTTGYRGDFVPFDQTSWVNPLLYQQFIFEKILSDEVDLRKFRLKLSTSVYVQLPRQNINLVVRCEQVTSRGLLFSLSEQDIKNKLKKEDKIVVYMNLANIKKLMDVSLEQMQENEIIQNKEKLGPLFSGDQKDAFYVQVKDIVFNDSFLLQSCHIMIPYEAFANINTRDGTKVENIVPGFLNKLEFEIRDQLNVNGERYILKKVS